MGGVGVLSYDWSKITKLRAGGEGRRGGKEWDGVGGGEVGIRRAEGGVVDSRRGEDAAGGHHAVKRAVERTVTRA